MPELLPFQFLGFDYDTDFNYDYDFFDALSLQSAFQLATIPVDIDTFLYVEGCSYCQSRFFEIKSEDVLRPDAQDFENIVESWKKNHEALFAEIQNTNEAIIDEFNALEDICVFADKFDSFLDELTIAIYCNHVKVSWYYSSYTASVFSWDDMYELISGYIEEIVNRGDLILADFELWDDTFVYTINDKFGFDDYNEDEE